MGAEATLAYIGASDEDNKEFLCSLSAKRQADLFALLVSHPTIQCDPIELNTDMEHVCIEDGVYRIADGKILPLSPEYRFTRKLQICSADVLNPTNEGAVDRLLTKGTGGNEKAISLIEEMVGTCLIPRPPKNIFHLEGTSDSGKSVLLGALRDLLGAESCLTLKDLNDLKNRFALAELQGKSAIICSDLPNAPISNETVGTLKQLSGGTDAAQVRIEAKYHNPRNVRSTATVVLASNYPIQTLYHDDALCNRVLVIPYTNAVPRTEQDPDFPMKVRRELGYLFLRAIAALRRLKHNGFHYTIAVSSGSVIATTLAALSPQSDYNEEIGMFLTDCTEINADSFAFTDDLYGAYTVYCTESCFAILSKQVFSSLLAKAISLQEAYRNVTRKSRINPTTHTNGRGYAGLALSIQTNEALKSASE